MSEKLFSFKQDERTNTVFSKQLPLTFLLKHPVLSWDAWLLTVTLSSVLDSQKSVPKLEHSNKTDLHMSRVQST